MILKKAYFSYDAMKQALSGEDKRVLYEMYVPCHNDLMLYCLGKFNDVELAKDAASETIQKLLEHPSPSDIENLRAWLLTVAKNACLGILNKQKRRSGILESVSVFFARKQNPEAEQHLNVEDLYTQCRSLLNEQDYTIWRYSYEGYKDDEIAQMLGLTPKTVANKKSMIRKRLRDQLIIV